MFLLLYCQSWARVRTSCGGCDLSEGVVLAAGDSEKFGVTLIFSKVYVELVLVVFGLVGEVVNVAVEGIIDFD